MNIIARLWTPRQRVTRTASITDTHLTLAQCSQGVGIDAQMPNSMPRAEDDVNTRAQSGEFHDRPGSGRDTANRHSYF